MNRTKVESSNLASVGYDKASKTLEIEFHNGGNYQYFAVEKEVFEALINADSHGTYFIHHIKDDYNYNRIR